MRSHLITSLLFISVSACKTRDFNPQSVAKDIVPDPRSAQVKLEDVQFWSDFAGESLDFFIRYAWSPSRSTFYSEIDTQGKPQSKRIYLVSASRMLYSMSWGAVLVPKKKEEYLDYARKSFLFFKRNFIRSDQAGPYFVKSVDLSSQETVAPSVLQVGEQASAIGGILAYYRVTRDKESLELLRDAYRAFEMRFHDRRYGGFYDRFDLERKTPSIGGLEPTKSFSSTVSVGTTFLAELAEIDADPQNEVFKTNFELAEIIVNRFIDTKTDWIVENFNREWKPEWREEQKQEVEINGKKNNVTVGIPAHNIQTARFLLRVASFKGTEKQRSSRYRKVAFYILEKMVEKSLRSEERQIRGPIDTERGGFFPSFQRETDEVMWNTNKVWWHQLEGIQTFVQAACDGVLDRALFLSIADRATRFYFTYFKDRRLQGGEFLTVDRAGLPDNEKLKGSEEKNAYHSIELARFMIQYAPMIKSRM